MASFHSRSTKIMCGVLFLLCTLMVKADEWGDASQVVEKSLKRVA